MTFSFRFQPFLALLFCLFGFAVFAQNKGQKNISKQEQLVKELLAKPISEDSATLNRVRQALNTHFTQAKLGYQAYKYLADFCHKDDAPQLAVTYYIKALQHLEADGKRESAEQKKELLNSIIAEFEKLNLPDSESIYLEKSLSLQNDSAQKYNSLFRIAHLAELAKNNARAKDFYLKAQKLASTEQRNEIKIRLLLIQMAEGKATLPELKKAFDSIKIETSTTQRFYLEYAKLLMSKEYILMSEMPISRLDIKTADSLFHREIVQLKASYHKALLETDKVKIFEDSLLKIDSVTQKMVDFPNDKKWEELFNQPPVYKKEDSKPWFSVSRKQLKWVLIIAASILFLIVLAIVWRRIIKVGKSTDQTAEVNYQTEIDDSLSQADIRSAQEVRAEILAKLHEIQRLNDANEISDAVNKLTMELEGFLNEGKTRPRILENVDQLFGRFYTGIDKKFPAFDHRQKELMGLIRLNMTVSEIADLWNVSEISVLEYMRELKSQLELTNEDDLYVFMANL